MLMLLAVAFFTEATLGLSGHALRAYARIRWILVSDVAAAITGIVLFLLLIPRYGAMGAAVGSVAFRVVVHVFYMGFTHYTTDVRALSTTKMKIFLPAVLAVFALVGLRYYTEPHWAAIAPLIVVAWLAVAVWNRSELAVERAFPGLAKFPILGRLFQVVSGTSVNDSTETM